MMLCTYSLTQSLFPNSQYCSTCITHCRRCIGGYLHMEGHISYCPPVSRAAQGVVIFQCALIWWYISIKIDFYFHNSLFPLQVPYTSCALIYPTHLDTRRWTDHNTGSSHYSILYAWPSTCFRHVWCCIYYCPPHNPDFTDRCAFGIKLSCNLIRAVRRNLHFQYKMH